MIQKSELHHSPIHEALRPRKRSHHVGAPLNRCATVYDQVVTDGICRPFGAQPKDGRGNFIQSGDALGRVACSDPRVTCCAIFSGAMRHCRVDRTLTNTVDSDAAANRLQGCGSRQHCCGCLGGGIRPHPFTGQVQAYVRGDVYDGVAATLSLHRKDLVLHAQPRAERVGLQNLIECVELDLIHVAYTEQACAVVGQRVRCQPAL